MAYNNTLTLKHGEMGRLDLRYLFNLILDFIRFVLELLPLMQACWNFQKNSKQCPDK